jgi:hypothetical protein
VFPATMSDDDEFDPNKDVPIWVNIVVPIVSGLIFIGVLIILFHTKKEVPLETIKDWVSMNKKCDAIRNVINARCLRKQHEEIFHYRKRKNPFAFN